MYDVASWIYSQQKPNNQMASNQMPSLIPNPLQNAIQPGMNMGGANPNPIPAYAQNAAMNPAAGSPTPPQTPGAPPTFPQSGMNGQNSLRNMLILQALMGGEDPRSAIMNGQAGGEGLRGTGGGQTDPNAGLLNSLPPQLAQRKRFIGSGY